MEPGATHSEPVVEGPLGGSDVQVRLWRVSGHLRGSNPVALPGQSFTHSSQTLPASASSLAKPVRFCL